MSDWTVNLEFEEGNSSKFWRARTDGKTLYVNYGKIGAAGQTQVKDFGSPELATKEYEKLIREKRKKGYADAGGGGSSAEDDDEDVADDGADEGEDEAPPPKPAKPPAASAPAAKPAGQRLTLESGSRKVETYVQLDGQTLRMTSSETYSTAESAKKAHERLKKTLVAEGYTEG